MTLNERIYAFSILGDKIKNLSNEELDQLKQRAKTENPWFTPDHVEKALEGIAFILEKQKLQKWLSDYKLNPEVPKIVGVVMAGNIPLVGFHDMLSILLSGHFAAIKTSSDDDYLPKTIANYLLEIEPRFKKNLEFWERLNNIDAVIATGSDNTARYFEYYFRDIPKVIRKNRTSIAVLDGSETSEELSELGKDIFWYFGLGCRNVSKLIIPEEYDPKAFFEAIEHFSEIGNHHKYRNNYDYYKSIFLVNRTKHLDNGFLLWLPTKDLVSPLSVLYAQEISDKKGIENYLNENKEKIQCVIGHGYIPFGKAQLPEPWDYADRVDTLEFLSGLN